MKKKQCATIIRLIKTRTRVVLSPEKSPSFTSYKVSSLQTLSDALKGIECCINTQLISVWITSILRIKACNATVHTERTSAPIYYSNELRNWILALFSILIMDCFYRLMSQNVLINSRNAKLIYFFNAVRMWWTSRSLTLRPNNSSRIK